MTGALFIVAAIITVLVLWSRVHELRAQLTQTRRERDTYAQIYEDWICADYLRATKSRPLNFRELPDMPRELEP